MKKHRYQITALVLSLIMVAGSLSGTVFAAQTSEGTEEFTAVESSEMSEDIEATEESEASNKDSGQSSNIATEEESAESTEIIYEENPNAFESDETQNYVSQEEASDDSEEARKNSVSTGNTSIEDVDTSETAGEERKENSAGEEKTSTTKETTVITTPAEQKSVSTNPLETREVVEEELTVYSNSYIDLNDYVESDNVNSRIISEQENIIVDCFGMDTAFDYNGIQYEESFLAYTPGNAIIEVYNPDTNQVFRRIKVTVLQNSGEIIVCKDKRADFSFYDSIAWAGDFVNNNGLVGLEADESLNIRAKGANDLCEDWGTLGILHLKSYYENFAYMTPTKIGNYTVDFISYHNPFGNPFKNVVYRLKITVVNHDYSEWKVTKKETCNSVGTKEKICSICGEKDIEEIPATGHIWNETYTVDKEASCTEEGSESIHCSVCGEINAETIRVIPKKEHVYSDWTVTKEASCTEDGSKEKVCADCNDKVTETIPATGHTWNEDYTIDKEATCTEEGSESIHCSVCGAIDEETVRVIPKKEHAYGDWTVTKEATCTETGIKEKTCKDCNDKVTETIPSTGHTWNEDYTIDKEATCTEEGSESIHCSVCDAIDEETVRVIPKKEHAYGDWTVTKEATCTEEGSKEKSCADCGDIVTETIPATGHTWNEEYTVDKEATYTEEGSESIHCSICDEIKEGTLKPIARLLKPVSMLTVSGIVDKVYSGKALTQEIVIKDGTTELIQDTDYTVSYENNTNAGTASITITGKGNYTGTKTIAFKIIPVGWYEEEGEQYYYKEDGTKLTNGWAKNETTWYWMDNDGKITKNKWVQSAGKWYYMGASGAMATGWLQIGGKWYYMNSSGVMTTGWQSIGGKWYYFNTSGAMVTGWQKISNVWYYFNSSGAMQTGWQKIGGKWYYFKSSGAMVTGRQQIGGKWYTFSSSGVMQ